MRIPIIAANWKMHKTLAEAHAFVKQLLNSHSAFEDVEVLVAPPFTLLQDLSVFLKNASIKLCGQNLYPEREGAFTGEISPIMLRDCGCQYVIVGHSERRQYFSEGDDLIHRKLKAALDFDLTPILCVGETLEERAHAKTESVILGQLKGALHDINFSAQQSMVIAYEPVWAIGTGETASAQDAQAGAKLIRDALESLLGKSVADQTRIQYGGSVKPENAVELISLPDVDGALVGGASLDPKSFSAIVNAAGGRS